MAVLAITVAAAVTKNLIFIFDLFISRDKLIACVNMVAVLAISLKVFFASLLASYWVGLGRCRVTTN
jgi:hypothetical protein